jgi:hypothetical protein
MIKMNEKNVVKEKLSEFKSGFTWRSLVAMLYSLFVFSPAIIWLNLVTITATTTGQVGLIETRTVYNPIAIISLLIISEVASIYGKPLTKQEAAIIFGPASAAGSAGFLTLIWKAYYARSPLLSLFGISGSQIPTWWAPPFNSPVWDMRTFFHPDWFMPILLLVITWLLSSLGGLFFGLIGRELFIEGEDLPFPMQQITSTTIDVLSEKKTDRMTIVSWTGIFALLYGIILYTIPTVAAAQNLNMRFIPIPWIDLTPFIETALPSGTFGIATDALIFASGFIIPPLVVIGMFVGTVARFLVINPALYNMGISEWANRWVAGMTLTQIYQQSTLFFWLDVLIGVGFAVGIVPLIFRWRIFARAIKSAFKFTFKPGERSKRRSGPPFPAIGLIIFFLALPAYIVLDLYLVPDFPIWPLIIAEFVFPFMILLGVGRMIGVSGQGNTPPYMAMLTVWMSGYEGIDAWYLPLQMHPGIGWLQTLKVAQLTKTKATSFIKASLIGYPLALISGYLYMSLFWEIAPIPSDLYPTAGIQWPINTINHLVWVSRKTEFFQPIKIGAGFGVIGAAIAISELLRFPTAVIGVSAGLGIPIPVVTTMLFGVILKFALGQFLGKQWIKKYSATIAAGLGLGESLAIIFGVAIALAAKSIWPGTF